jgi:ubiquinone/menaquinone biosynthesis C-methylase UbiE
MSQDQTLQQYQQLIQLNSASHLIRTAREIGLFDLLQEGQQTAEALIARLDLQPQLAHTFLDSLRAIGVIEQYQEDFALTQVTRLLCEHDADLGDAMWARLPQALRDDHQPEDDEYHAAVAATQWVHTATAMEAAEILNIGEDRKGLPILDLGCGSAVWSCAIAYRDPDSRVTAVDHPGALLAAQRTADSIALGDRFDTIAGPIEEVELPAEAFDLVLLATRLHALPRERGSQLLRRIHDALAPGGELVVIDLFQPPGKTKLAEAAAALRLQLTTESGAVRSPPETEQLIEESGFAKPQFTYLPASQINKSTGTPSSAVNKKNCS